MKAFSFSNTPHLHLGPGKLSVLPGLISRFGSKVLLVTGARSFITSEQGAKLLQQFRDQKIECEQYAVTTEPTPDTIDGAVERFSSFSPDCVVAVGGGSALDAGKAISAMLPLNAQVKDFLEGVGTQTHPGSKLPFIAVPTTSGTGSEATKNAVISEIGEHGYKRSLRHEKFVPDIAIVDPLLTLQCPPATTAASGMDAFTQLLESYLSTAANPLTDALALEGLHRISKSLTRSFHEGDNVEARTDMALASYLSGVTLANAGLGVVHGLASPIGGRLDIPHGVICSALMAASNRVTVRLLRERDSNAVALTKYAIVGRIFSGDDALADDHSIDFLLDTIDTWTSEMKIPSLRNYGLTSQHFSRIIEKADSKNNPVAFTPDEMLEVLESI